jgi:hypothetical protein
MGIVRAGRRMTRADINLLVDGIFFQLDNRTGIARVWRTVLPKLAKRLRSITLLDRGNAPEIPGVVRIPFPAYTGQPLRSPSSLNNCARITEPMLSHPHITAHRSAPR